MIKKRGQIAIEYLMIVGFATFVVISLLGISEYYKGRLADHTVTTQVDRLARELADTAEQVYYLGEPSKTTIKVYVPENIESITITGKEIWFKVRTRGGITDITYSTAVNVIGSLSTSPGLRDITVEAKCGVECYALIQD